MSDGSWAIARGIFGVRLILAGCWESWVGSEQMPNGQATAMSRTQARIGRTSAEEGRLN
jgi:hypothetical protein